MNPPPDGLYRHRADDRRELLLGLAAALPLSLVLCGAVVLALSAFG